MLEKKELSYPGLGPNTENIPEGLYWDEENSLLNAAVRPLTAFADKCDDKGGCGLDYDIAYDYHGPKIFAPSHCIKSFDYNRPKQVSPYVAIIGTQTNITD